MRTSTLGASAALLVACCACTRPSIETKIEGVTTSVAAFVDCFPDGPVDEPTLVRTVDEFESLFGKAGLSNEPGCNVRQFFVNGGAEAWIVRLGGARSAGVSLGDSVRRTGMYALDRVERFNLLCLPQPTDTLEAKAFMVEAGRYCARRRAMYLAEMPRQTLTLSEMTRWISRVRFLDEGYVAVYYPMVRTPEQPAGMTVSGTVAGVFARLDTHYGVWHAPAGHEALLHNVTGFTHDLTPVEIEHLHDSGINPLRETSAGRRVVWGVHTLSPEPEWQYVHVRRLASYIEESIVRGTQWTTFEPNNEALWARVRTRVHEFLFDLYKRRALLGSKPSEAFFVTCDRSTTTEKDIANNRFTIVVGFAVLKTAEFIVLRIQQTAGTTP